MFRPHPERVSAHPHAIIASGQSAAELLVPTAGDLLEIELVTLRYHSLPAISSICPAPDIGQNPELRAAGLPPPAAAKPDRRLPTRRVRCSSIPLRSSKRRCRASPGGFRRTGRHAPPRHIAHEAKTGVAQRGIIARRIGQRLGWPGIRFAAPVRERRDIHHGYLIFLRTGGSQQNLSDPPSNCRRRDQAAAPGGLPPRQGGRSTCFDFLIACC
jgi:hypothetical protein